MGSLLLIAYYVSYRRYAVGSNVVELEVYKKNYLPKIPSVLLVMYC
jgi:hypothetical protein